MKALEKFDQEKVKKVAEIIILLVGFVGISLIFNALLEFPSFCKSLGFDLGFGTLCQLVTIFFFLLNLILVLHYFRDIQRKLEKWDYQEPKAEIPCANNSHKGNKRTSVKKEHNTKPYSFLFFQKTGMLLIISFFELVVAYIWDLCIGIRYGEESNLLVSCLSMTIPLITVFIVASCFLVGRNEEQLNRLQHGQINNLIVQAFCDDFEDVVYTSVDRCSFLVRTEFVYPINKIRKKYPQCMYIQLDSIRLSDADSDVWRLNNGNTNIPLRVCTYVHENENTHISFKENLNEVCLKYTYRCSDDSTERSLLVKVHLGQQ